MNSHPFFFVVGVMCILHTTILILSLIFPPTTHKGWPQLILILWNYQGWPWQTIVYLKYATFLTWWDELLTQVSWGLPLSALKDIWWKGQSEKSDSWTNPQTEVIWRVFSIHRLKSNLTVDLENFSRSGVSFLSVLFDTVTIREVRDTMFPPSILIYWTLHHACSQNLISYLSFYQPC